MARRAWLPNPNMTVKLGAKGRQVVWLQKCLHDLGYPVGPLDGHYGYVTEDSLCSLQRDYGLKVDGIAGPRVMQLLQDNEALIRHSFHLLGHDLHYTLCGYTGHYGQELAKESNYELFPSIRGIFLDYCFIGDSSTSGTCHPEWTKGTQSNQVALIPVIGNLCRDHYDVPALITLLHGRQSRRKLLQTIGQLMEGTDYGGIALNFHGTEFGYGRNLFALAKDIGGILKRYGKKLYITLVPSLEGIPFPGHVDLRMWTVLPHRVILSAFQEHVAGTPGPRLGLSHCQAIFHKVTGYIPPWKLIMMIPLGGISWTVGGDLRQYEYLSYNEVRKRAYEKQAKSQWDAVEKVFYYDYREGEKRVRVWYENRDSLGAKLAWLEGQHIGGVILAPLGWEYPRIWQ